MVVTKGKRQGQGRDFQSCVTVLAWFVLPSEITNWCGLPSAMSFLDYVESSHRLESGSGLFGFGIGNVLCLLTVASKDKGKKAVF